MRTTETSFPRKERKKPKRTHLGLTFDGGDGGEGSSKDQEKKPVLPRLRALVTGRAEGAAEQVAGATEDLPAWAA